MFNLKGKENLDSSKLRRGKYLFSAQPAFSIVEIMTVLFIISLGLVGILSLIVQNIKSQSYNKKTIMAYQLAQEGIELIRKTRDANWRLGYVYNHGFKNNNIYCMDYTENTPYEDATGACAPLYLDNNGFYVRTVTATSSGFSRKIFIANAPSESNFVTQVSSTVYWIEHGTQNNYSLVTTLYDWR